MAGENKQIIDELRNLRIDVKFIKEHMVDVDTILTSEEKQLLDESIENEKAGKLISLEELERVRNKVR